MPCRLAPLLAAILSATCLAAAGCAQDPSIAVYPTADLRPPGLLDAGPSGSKKVLLHFDEAVTPVAGSIAIEPPAAVSGSAEGETLVVDFGSEQSPGADYALVGEVDDLRGNRTRFLIRFVGWNDRAPPLMLSEVQTGKNGSKTKPHRDFVELEVMADGNVGGEELSWTSSVKSAAYRFPGIEVKKGDYIVLHLAPEGIPDERDELGSDLSASGGIDATATGRDLWCGSMGLPDASGAVSLCVRPGSPPIDGLFYADDGKSGALDENKLSETLSSLSSAGAWPLSGASPAWEDGVPWNGSAARSLCRSGSGKGPAGWYVCASGGQTPGAANAAPAPEVPAASAAKAQAKAPAMSKTAFKNSAPKTAKRTAKKKP
jgi:hypothetical protein